MIVPGDAGTAARLRSERNQGRAADMGWLDHDGLGFNYRLSDLAAALGVAQVERLDSLLSRRDAVASLYAQRLAGVEGVETPIAARGEERRSWFVYVVRLADDVDRDATIARLAERGDRQQGLPALHPPLPAPARAGLSRGPIPGCRSRRRPLAGAALLPGDERGPGGPCLSGAGGGARSGSSRGIIARSMSRFRKDPTRASGASTARSRSTGSWRPTTSTSRSAHARGLLEIGVLDDDELATIEAGLERVQARMAEHGFEFEEADEDIHMAIERLLGEQIGPFAGKLHTGRSRNDQVATDVAIVVQAHSLRAIELCGEAMERLLELAEAHSDWPMPGYTHLQRAQPVYLGHHLLAYFWMLARDVLRFQFALDSASVMPLGSGALAGVNWEIDRDVGRRRPRLRRTSATTRSTAPRTATSCSTTWRPPRPARCTSRGWARNW